MEHQIQMQQNAEQTYISILHSSVEAQRRFCAAVNSAMVMSYQKAGEQIFKARGESDRAGYGKKFLEYLSDQLTAEFGQGYTVCNLRAMRQFYMMFPNRYTMCSDLTD